MLVLGIETSTRIGSVALVKDGQLLVEADHDSPNAHGEKLLGLIDSLMAETGLTPSEISTIAVGRGPGSFTGLRIGLSLAQGIAVGLGIPAVGVGSMRAMAEGLSRDSSGPRLVLLDARRGELFFAAYSAEGIELAAPSVFPRSSLNDVLRARIIQLRERLPGNTAHSCYLVGAVCRELIATELDLELLRDLGVLIHNGRDTDYPSAKVVATVVSAGRSSALPTADYLRDADAILPNLPPCPLDLPRP